MPSTSTGIPAAEASPSHAHAQDPGNDILKCSIVAEYRCIFTEDVNKKNKRWQDGRFTRHSFNQRALVYDDRGNLIGGDCQHLIPVINEGDELQLDIGHTTILIQVQERIGDRQQDLSELVGKRVHEREQRALASLPVVARLQKERAPLRTDQQPTPVAVRVVASAPAQAPTRQAAPVAPPAPAPASDQVRAAKEATPERTATLRLRPRKRPGLLIAAEAKRVREMSPVRGPWSREANDLLDDSNQDSNDSAE